MSWEIVTLDDITSKIGDGLHGTPKYDENGDYFFINGNNLRDGRIEIKDDTKRINSEQYLKIKKELNNQTIFVAINGTIGNIGLYNGEKIALGKSACYLNINDQTEKLFIRYVLENDTFQSYAQRFATGATIKNLGLKAIRNFEFPLPPLPTQKRIADILSAYDDLIENNLKRIKLLEEAAQNIYKEWFVHLRFPGHENTPINEETGLPQGWEERSFSDVSVNNNRKRIPMNGTDRSKRQGPYRYYGATGIMDYIDDYIFDGRFLLIAEDGTVNDNMGNAYTQLVEGKFWVNNHAHIISGGILPVEYLYLAMKHYPIGHLITGAVQLKLSMKNLKRVDIINPSKDILNSFMSIANPLINQIFTLNQQNRKLKAARDILLPRLMNRTIEV